LKSNGSFRVRLLEDQVQTTTSDLNRAREALDQQRLQANKLNNQIKDLDSAKQNAQQELDLVKSQLSTARDEVSEQLRSILVYQAAFLAGEIYDQRFYTSLYQTPPPGVLVATTTPVFTGDDKCFNRFSQSATFTWWSFIDCIGANEKFPWPSDSAEKKRIEDALTKWKNACGRLTREFVIAPKAGQDTKEDRAANEIVEFKIYELSSDASLQNAFCH